MDPRSAAHAYKQDAVESAPPIKIVRMLLQASLRFIDQADRSDPKQPDSPFVERVGRVDAIAMELRLALDPSVDPEFCARMEQLYLFVEAHAQEALEARSAEPLQAARKVLATLLETWSEVELEGSPGSEGARDAA